MMISPIKTVATLGLAQKRALLAARLRQAANQPRQCPLSFAQQRLWFLDQLEPNSPLYNIGSLARIRGRLDIGALERAFDQVVARHETLRTRFTCPDEAPVQTIDPHQRFHLAVFDFSIQPQAQREVQARQLVQAQLNRPFNLAAEHPLRVTVVRLASDDHRLLVVLHHIVGDEWSLRILFAELAAFYTAEVAQRSATLPDLPIQYADYAGWQREWMQGAVLQEQLDYWKSQLKNHPPATELATDHPRPAIPTFPGRTATRVISPALAQALAAVGQQREATPFMVLLAAFKALVLRYTQQEDLIVCCPVAGRSRAETEGLIGFFVNTLALRTDLSGDLTFDQLLQRVREVTLGAMAHADVPFDRVVEELQPERTLTHLPFTKLMFAFQAAAPERLELPGASLEFLEVEAELAKFELTLTLRQTTGGGLQAGVEYNRDLFEPDTMERFLGHYVTLLQSIAAAPGQPISRLALLTPSERHQLLVEWNQTHRPYPSQRAIHQLFEAQVERTPETIAVSWGGQKMTYRELNGRANQLARFLRQFELSPDAPVGLCVERSLEMVVGVLGILKAGGAYVPLDAHYPKDRLAFMLEDTQAPVVLTQQRLLQRLPRNGAKIVCLDADWEFIARETRENLTGSANGDSLAYIMYTSGSTGRPKGVAVPHRAVNRLVVNNDFLQVNSSDRIAQVSNISFDAATFEIWGALLNGAQLVGITRDVALSPRDFAAELSEQGITAMFLTAALFNQLASEAPGAFQTLRTVIAGGEALEPKWVRSVLSNRPPRRLVNGYGPTENTTFTCCHTIESVPEGALNVPIGRPISNTSVYILDRHLNPVPIGVPGELYTGGDGLARGYWKRPELNDQRFIPHPFQAEGNARLYRTGDLARYRPDGSIEFLGRIDDQVKIRGFRIELGEIETVLSRHPAIRECVVTVTGSDSVNKRLVAYVAAGPDQPLNASDIRGFLTRQLPDYMIPSAFVKLDALPLTPNGKVDRNALPAPDQSRPKLDRQYVGPRDATESQLVGIWEAVLGVRPIGIQDKFFDLGGHSMLAVRVSAQIEKTFGKKLRLATLFQAPTIERLAAVLREEIKESSVAGGTSLVEIQGAGSRPPLFLVHGAGGGMFWGYINLARSLGNDQPVYGFKSRGLDGREEFATIEELAAHYVADMRRVQPQGPYYLGGYCFGGNVAYEMACQLSEQGQEVAFVAVLNCAPPNSSYSRIPWTLAWALRFVRNLVYWANYSRQWSTTQRREFFRWKWQLLKKKLMRASSPGRGELSRVEPGDLVDLSSYTEDQKLVWETHIRALMKFQPRRYRGRLYLFRSPGHPLWCSFDESYGWNALIEQGVERITVSGAHERILEEPWVGDLAKKLSAALADSTRALPVASVGAAAPAPPVAAGKMEPASRPLEPNRASAQANEAADLTYPQVLASRIEPFAATVAIRFRSQQLTYRELDRRSNQLAHYLQGLGIGPEALVAVALERSLDLGIGLLAVMKAGGAYLPLDPEYPADRLEFMLKDARPAVLLTNSKVMPGLAHQGLRCVCLDDPQVQEALSQCLDADPRARLTAENLAYVIYTSGSTGVPKGVEITQSALINHNLAVLGPYQLQAGDRVLQFTPLSFDISVEEIFPTWLAGATLVLRTDEAISSPENFVKFIAGERITVLNLPTAYWHELVEFLHASGTRLPSTVRLVVIGGEKASEAVYGRWKQCVGGAVRLMNGYGATEATITTTLYEAQPGDDTLAIGRPIANTQTILLDAELRPVPPGAAGELCIGGLGLARGYLNRPELTAEAFIPNPAPDAIASPRLYRTGDVARLRADGNLEFVGRLDDQVKIRGYRIELGEIEAALRAEPDVKEAAVVIREGTGGKRVVGYYVPRSSAGPALSRLLAGLKRKLPQYMIPSALVPLAEMPLTPAGKIDRQRLPAPGTARPELDQQFVAAASPVETQLASIWTELLEISGVGINDNFIELGGHSLLATKALSRIRETFGVELSLADFFARPTISALARQISGQAASTSAAGPELLLEHAPQVPLSPFQERIWFLDQLDPNQTAYNRAIGVRLRGPLNRPALERSLQDLAERHDALRAVFPGQDSGPCQCLASPKAITLVVKDLSAISTAERQQRALELAAQEACRPYILSHPVLKPLLLRLDDQDHWLVLILNKIGAGEQSVRVILRDLPALYEAALTGHPAQLSCSVHQYRDFLQSTQLSEQEQNRHREFWKRQLEGVPELLDLPADRPRPAQGDYAGARYSFHLPESTVAAVQRLMTFGQAEAFPVFLAGFAAVLHRYTGIERVVVGATASVRTAESQDSVGAFENPVALCCDLSGDPGFDEVLRRCAHTVQEAWAHSALPFGDVVLALCPRRSPSYTPIFQVAISVQTEPLPEVCAGGLGFSACEIDTQTSKLDLSLKLVQTQHGFSGHLEYSTALFDSARIVRLIGHLQTVLESAAAEVQRPVSRLRLLPSGEFKQLVEEWNRTALEYPREKTLVDLFREQVLSTPQRQALVWGRQQITYGQLYGRAAELAKRLRSLGVANEVLVGICLERSPQMIVAILGTLLAGGAYVPLDPRYPEERLAFSLQDANCKVLITQSSLKSRLPSTGAQVLYLEPEEGPAPGAADFTLQPIAKPTDLAYVIYTSGSTGKPKGVALEHRNAVGLMSWAATVFTLEELSGVLASTSICFDLSVFEMFVPLCHGGRIILADNALALRGLPAASEVTLLNTVPSAMRELLRLRAVPAGVKVVNLAGEPLAPELVDQIYRETSVEKVFDLYGPTETTTYSTGTLRRAGQPATIGRPLANEQVFLLDPHLNPVPVGVPGELHIGGVGVARGYLNRPELTAQKFIPSPFQSGGRLYRTGDLARWRADGSLEYLGRMDHQVKIRGFRIELGEVESALKRSDGVASALAMAREDQPGDQRLVAYVVGRPGTSLRADDLKQQLRKHLPDFMVPSDLVFLSEMPMTPNGKVDRKVLPPPAGSRSEARGQMVEPRNELERRMAELWCEVLRLKQISIEENFFDLGGHSLLAVRIISAIRDAFKVELPLSALFSAPTVAGLSEKVSAELKPEAAAAELAIVAVDRKQRLPVSYVQERLWFLHQLEPGSAAYNVPIAVRLKGELNPEALRQALETLVARHEALRTGFELTDQGLAQVIRPPAGVEVPCLDLRDTPAAQREQRARELLQQQARRGFDLSRGPLARFTLLRLEPTEHILLTVMHHTICDGWSLALFLQDLGSLYDDLAGQRPIQAPSLPSIQYADFAHWQRRWMTGPVLEAELAYWKNVLAGAPAEIALPGDHPRPERPSGRAETISARLDGAVEAKLQEVTRRESCTPFVAFLTALLVVLRKWTGQQDLVIGTVVAGRTRRELENLLGCFMNFLPLRAALRDDEPVGRLLQRVRTTVLEAQSHQDCPFEKIVEAVNPQRRQGQNPLYNVALLLQNFPPNLLQLQSLETTQVPVAAEAALLDLRFEIERVDGTLSLSCEYRTDLFERRTIEGLLSAWVMAIESVIDSPTTPVGVIEAGSGLRRAPEVIPQAHEAPPIIIAATFTAEPLREPLEYWWRRLELPERVEFAPYNQVFQQLLDPHSECSRNRTGANVLLVRLQDWARAGATGATSPDLSRVAEEFLQAVKGAAERAAGAWLVVFCPGAPAGTAAALDAELLDRLQGRLEHELAAISGVYVLTRQEFACWYPVEAYYDPAGEELGHVPYTPLFFTALATAIARKLHALKRPQYKVIALDCDNTLWAGICGEEGPRGIRLDAPRQTLQQFMLAQRDSGMLLCLCSKNNPQDVREVFAARSEFPLSLEMFAAVRLNWEPKSANLKALAAELGLGLDSFIFVDDNPVECAEVQANCPEVLTLQLPEEPERIPQFLQHCWAFDHLKLTREDRQRAELYQQNQLRERLRAEAPTLQDFLAGLQLQIDLQPIAPGDYSRVAQLTQRTNQFNLTTRRRSESELGQCLNSGEGLAVRVSDRFGDYGLVGVVLYRISGQTLEVDTFLLSCRVLGRGVEHRVLAHLADIARSRRAEWLDLHFTPTAKNQPASDFLERVGSAYRQALNGGFIFRFPVGVAGGIVFQPTVQATDARAGDRQPPKDLPLRTTPSASRFSRCQEIALQSNDPARIQAAVQGSVSVRQRGNATYVGPTNELETKLCQLWQELLRVQPVGIHDDFFELGGHSLMAVRLFAEIEKLVGRKFPLVTLFQAPTIAQLAPLLVEQKGAGSLLVPIQPRGDKPPLFLVHGAGGDVLWGYANLAEHLPADQPVYGIKSHGQQGQEEPVQLELMARSYLEVIRTRQPHGPYYLGGYCFGGNVAYEMARQLQMQGEQTALVLLLDTAPANAGYEHVTWYRPGFAWRFGRNLRYWLADFTALPSEERSRFIGRKLRWLGRKLKRRLGFEKGPARFDLEEVIDPGHFPQHELKLWQAHLEALIAHVERPYQGKVVLLRTRGQPLFCSLEDDFCWGRLVRPNVDVHMIPGSHENIFMEPHVRALAAEVDRLLDQHDDPAPNSVDGAHAAASRQPMVLP